MHVRDKTLRLTVPGVKAKPTITSSWEPVGQSEIEGVLVRETKNVIYHNGVLTEIYSDEWDVDGFRPGHIVYVTLLPGMTSPWHCHLQQDDVLFPIRGHIRVGLYDARENSPTSGNSIIMNCHIARPRYIRIPPGVWHALKNHGSQEAAYLAVNDLPYRYEDPDDWLLAPGADEIPVSLE